jgi:REP element-mobilizing transposase RayT
VHVTLRSLIGPLRSTQVFPSVRLAIASANARSPRSFRVVHFSVQRDHVHLIVEAKNAQALSAGVRSVAIRIARYVNEVLSRQGPLWDGRWRGRALTTPREMRNALLYVLANFRKHDRHSPRPGIDPYSSGVWFDGWAGWQPSGDAAPPWALRGPAAAEEPAVLPPTTRLAQSGWRRLGLLALDEAPGELR